MTRIGIAAAIGYVSTIFGANWLIQHVGFVSIGFGLVAPAGVFAAGFALGLRDMVQVTLGRSAVIVAIVVGAALSWLIAPAFAVASGVAFLFSELADMAVYTPLAERTWAGAIALSNTVGAVVDSALFLLIAFGSLQFIEGQVIGKLYTVPAAIVLMAAIRPRLEEAR